MWRRLKSPASRLFTQPFIQAQIKENTKAGVCAGNSPVIVVLIVIPSYYTRLRLLLKHTSYICVNVIYCAFTRNISSVHCWDQIYISPVSTAESLGMLKAVSMLAMAIQRKQMDPSSAVAIISSFDDRADPYTVIGSDLCNRSLSECICLRIIMIYVGTSKSLNEVIFHRHFLIEFDYWFYTGGSSQSFFYLLSHQSTNICSQNAEPTFPEICQFYWSPFCSHHVPLI